MKSWQLPTQTDGERFYDLTKEVHSSFKENCSEENGLLIIFNPHTSCGLTINESYDPSAATDMESFLKHLAPRNLKFIEHTTEGEDDSPSHMKSILLQNSLQLIVEDGEIQLGQWQGIYLCEFRDARKVRKMQLKFLKG